MSLLTPRPTYAPFEYEKAYSFWEQAQQSHWLHTEIQMANDINDWKSGILTETEKHVVAHILKGFTQSEIFIQEYWSQMVSKWFKIPEIQIMASAFASFESIHAVAYAYLNQSLGLEDFDAFLSEPTAKAKIDRLMSTKGKTKEEIARSLAIFSAFNEGVNLFSSFAILLNFSRFNKLKGVGQIIAFSIKDECFAKDTEILTPTGWKFFYELNEQDKVAQFDPKTQEISFVVPNTIIKKQFKGNMYRFSGEKLSPDIMVTPGHRMLFKWKNKENDNWKFEEAKDFKSSSPHKVIPLAGLKISGKKYLSAHEKFLIALQADGSMPSERYTGELCGTLPVTFSFSKERKINKFKEILKETGYSFSQRSDKKDANKKEITVFKVDVPLDKQLFKTFEWISLEDISHEWAKGFLNELICWDGSIPKASSGNYRYYSSSESKNVDMVQAIASIAGKWATRAIQKDERSDNYSDMHRCYIHEMSEKRLGCIKKEEVFYDDMVYCVSVPTEAVVVRRDGSVFVSGNCLHAEAGCWLFNTLVSEFPEIMTDELKKDLYDAARLTIELEDNFISKAFEKGPIEGLTESDMKAFIRHRANTKLNDIGLKKIWKNIDKEALERMGWFDVLSAGTAHSDFFASRVSDYSKGVVDFSKIWE